MKSEIKIKNNAELTKVLDLCSVISDLYTENRRLYRQQEDLLDKLHKQSEDSINSNHQLFLIEEKVDRLTKVLKKVYDTIWTIPGAEELASEVKQSLKE